ncbi:hypothetical protein IM697_20840 [Streptomyces ferrugineus]|uniref:Secreted protein n=1 Tax=Streptomyces ferrugineus TaxID=1413221 RepID=A0A7M2SWH5_9ACTN|nr:hypothetical protein [Streptomyces ferrugineus]QOV40632.1 hypothetical protein IM697_20840 [Streptomyces ferrugineus]
MISTRRIAAAVGLAVGVTGLAAPLANAGTADASTASKAGMLNPVTTLDQLAVSGVPADRRAKMPLPSQQLARLDQLKELSRQQQRPQQQIKAVDTPVTRMLPAVDL